jgi:flavin reductase (DIM6/NTAB) family NADH-FMN oxidoreductase RutF
MHDFERLVASLDYPMFVVTAASGTERAGCLVGFTTQCSIDPPRYVVCLSERNRTTEIAQSSAILGVHLLRADDEPLARLFGEATGDDIDKFEQCSWRAGPYTTPILRGTDWFVGKVRERTSVGDHILHVLDVVESGSEATDSVQFGSQAARELEPGHAP